MLGRMLRAMGSSLQLYWKPFMLNARVWVTCRNNATATVT